MWPWGLVRGKTLEHYQAKGGDIFDFVTRWTAVMIRDTDGKAASSSVQQRFVLSPKDDIDLDISCSQVVRRSIHCATL